MFSKQRQYLTKDDIITPLTLSTSFKSLYLKITNFYHLLISPQCLTERRSLDVTPVFSFMGT